jgi:tetratricopeptide (TPR) repeat protein
VLVGEHGQYRLTQDVSTLQVPATVQAVLAARIDRLPPQEKQLLQTAAVIGTEVPLPLLQTIAELPEDVVPRRLAHLQATEFLYETRLFPEREYTFKQALLALAHLSEHGDTRGLAIEIRLALGDGLYALGEYGRCLPLLGEAEALARALDDQTRLGRVLASMANARRITGDPDGAIVAAQQALALAAALGDSAMQGQASDHLGRAYYTIGDFGRAAELWRRNGEAADREAGRRSTNVRILSQMWLTWTLSTLGAFAEGRRHGEEALRLATLEGRGAILMAVHSFLGHLYLAQGDLEHAIVPWT